MTAVRFSALAATVIAFATLVITGCEADSPNSLERNVGVDYTGFYRGNFPDNRIAQKNSGTPVTLFNLRQTGARLEAVDNTGFVWKGDIGNNPSAENLEASFTLEGRTTAGADVVINGRLTKPDAGSRIASMDGSWIEPEFVALVSAAGSVNATSTNSSGSSLTISPSTATVGIGSSLGFTASGGSGTITWSVSGGGSVNPSTGASTTFTRTSAGTVTLSASASGGGSASATIN